jgi:ribosome biogenesis GTPase
MRLSGDFIVSPHGSRAPQSAGIGGGGTVVASYGRGVLVESGSEFLQCSLKNRKLRIVCGDRVAWTDSLKDGGPAIESLEPRRNLVERIDARGRAEPVAANIDRLAIVIAREPEPDWFLADRYWAGAKLKDLDALLIVNKSDLAAEAMRAELESYRALGLACCEVSALTGRGIEELKGALASGTTLMVGQSGVGKSSLVNALAPQAAAETQELTRDVEGRHTTTTARRYRLGAESALMDAPGVRDFAPPASLVRAAERGFVEIHRFSAECRFNDCRHMQEPSCAVRAAVLAGLIAPRRYESYRRLFRLYEKLAP